MRRFKALVLCVVLLVGGCRTLRQVGEVVVAGAVIAGYAYLHVHAHHHHHGGGHFYPGHPGRYCD